jgi:hypothetical protein
MSKTQPMASAASLFSEGVIKERMSRIYISVMPHNQVTDVRGATSANPPSRLPLYAGS